MTSPSAKPIPAGPSPAYGERAIYLPYDGPKPPWDWPGIRRGPYPNKKRGLGSTDATIIMGVSRFKSKFSLYKEIVGDIEKEREAKFPELAEVGTLIEPIIVELYRRRTRRTLIDRAEYTKSGRWDTRCHPDYPWLLANLDMEATIGNGLKLPFPERSLNGVVEAKSKESWAEIFDEEGNPTDEVMVQIQHQLLVTGYQWGSACFLAGRRFYYVDVEAHEKFQKVLLGELAEFWERCWNGDPPPVDASDATRDALLAEFPIEKRGKVVTFSENVSGMMPRYREINATIKTLEEEKSEIENFIKFEMGDAEEAVDLWKTTGFSYLHQKDGKDTFVIPTPQGDEEQRAIQAMGGVLKKGKKGSRTLRMKKPENVGKPRKRKS